MEWKYGDEGCGGFGTENNPVHKHSDGTWWFYDECWCQEYGPFDTEDGCTEKCIEYMGEL